MVCDISAESITKGIIVANSRHGITIQQIAFEYYQCTSEQWPLLNKSESYAIQYLEQIDGVLSIINEKNQLLWYVRGKTLNSENRGQIYRANTQHKSSGFGLSTNPHGSIPNTCFQYSNNKNDDINNNNNNNNNHHHNHNSRNGSSNKARFDRNNNNGYGDINGNYEPQNGMQQKFYKNDRNRMNKYSYGVPNNNDVFSSPDGGRRTSTTLYSYDLVGDDFFMELAKIDLGCHYTIRKRIQKSGFCISGQTIRDATDRIKHIPNPNNMKMIVNLGTVDILHGRDLADMCQDYMNLIRLCERRNITIIATTLAPLANRKHCHSDTEKWQEFNRFLMKRIAEKIQVIDIVGCMECQKTGKVLFDCFQPEARYVSGSNQPHMLWNRIGRQRILRKIKTSLRF